MFCGDVIVSQQAKWWQQLHSKSKLRGGYSAGMVDAHKHGHAAHHTGPLPLELVRLAQAAVDARVQQPDHCWGREKRERESERGRMGEAEKVETTQPAFTAAIARSQHAFRHCCEEKRLLLGNSDDTLSRSIQRSVFTRCIYIEKGTCSVSRLSNEQPPTWNASKMCLWWTYLTQ